MIRNIGSAPDYWIRKDIVKEVKTVPSNRGISCYFCMMIEELFSTWSRVLTFYVWLCALFLCKVYDWFVQTAAHKMSFSFRTNILQPHDIE